MPRRDNSQGGASRHKYSRPARGNNRGQNLVDTYERTVQRPPRREPRPSQEEQQNVHVDDLKLVTQRWEFRKEGKHKVLSDNTEFLVVGVIGGARTGKSTILNSICGFSSKATSPECASFPVGSPEDQACGKHCTVGIDMRVSSDRVIALDTQPVLSASVLLELLSCPSPCMELARSLSVAAARGARPPKTSAEAINMVMALQTAIFLFSVCHVVVVVCDGPDDTRMWKLMECVDIFAPLVSSATPMQGLAPQANQDSKEGFRFIGDCVFLHTNMSQENMMASRIAALENSLQHLMVDSKLCRRGLVSCWSGTPLQQPKGMDNGGDRRKNLSFFVLPKESPSNDYEDQNSLLKVLMTRLRRQILGYPLRQFAHGLTEQEWLIWCGRVWDTLLKSKDVAEYFFRLQLTSYKDGGGW
ncbi:hypothetical protein BSKO_00863 [Bryopsis sp. KO-2023]|nr:hypothetical protein BSKO_00863 [Bryopsis sp. KO-2023]